MPPSYECTGSPRIDVNLHGVFPPGLPNGEVEQVSGRVIGHEFHSSIRVNGKRTQLTDLKGSSPEGEEEAVVRSR